MASHQLKRTMRGAVAAGAVMAAVGMASTPASADPNGPTNAGDALQQFQQLSTQAEQVNEDLLKAQIDLKNKQGDLDRANADLAQAKQLEAAAQAAEDQFRGQVDQLTDASFQGARFNQLSALLTSNSAQDFLDRSAALNILASDNYDVMSKLAAAVAQAADARKRAEDAQRRAQQATDAAAQLTQAIAAHKQDLQNQITQLRAAMNRLTAAQKSSLMGSAACGAANLGTGAVATALEAALSKCGAPYVWGGSGPNSFDCSGLTMWAFGKAGISLPHSAAAQYNYGTSVSRSDLQPGDLVFFGSSASSIHHVGISLGGNKMVDASTEGVPVGIHSLYSDYYGAKRLAG
ncbi:hydrolase Nlp/P60 [Gandjariella thermophila]|uniref:Hydrolase Nlp/P60 n=1 Tax=Gandjariella thermophila TaxID=1931992 RepID=A0A4D4J1M0_9PSEU|nr:hydrolase Nlp/P60 [Gandjariella thermophila]